MGHVVIIIDGVPTPQPDPEERSAQSSETSATVRYTPTDDATPEQIGAEVARHVRKVRRIVDGSDA